MYDTKYQPPPDRTIWSSIISPTGRKLDPKETGKFEKTFQPGKKTPTTRFYNQRGSGSFGAERDYSQEVQEARLEKRAESYENWRGKDNRVSRKQLAQEPRDKIEAVASSWLTSLGYNTETNEAIVTFHGSTTEFYYRMSWDTFLDWFNSPSKGRWLHDHPQIMHNYTMRGGRGGNSMQDRLDSLHKTNRLKRRGSQTRLQKKLEKWR